MGGPDREAARPSSAFTSPTEYAGLVYGKAPYAYVALRRALGDAALEAALRSAVQRERFALVTLAQWIDAVEAGAGDRRALVRPIFDRYLRQAHGDEDLGVDDSGDFVLRNMLPGGGGKDVTDALALVGMKPKDVLRMVYGAGGAGPAEGARQGLDPAEALKLLEKRKR